MSIRLNSTFYARRTRARNEVRGTIILPALVVVGMVATLSMIFVQVSLSKNKEQRVSVDSKRAFYMAEAGLSEGFNGLCLGKSGNVASETVPAEFGFGLFWTVAEELGSGRVKLESTGLAGAGRATLSLTCERSSENIGALGFFGGQDITVQAGALIDSYDSRIGTYASQALLAPVALPGARLGGNRDIQVQGSILKPTFIYGDANPGPMGSVFRSLLGTTITGSKAPSPATIEFPVVKPPELPGPENNLKVESNQSLPSGAYKIKDFEVKNDMILILNGPMVIVAEKLKVGKEATFKINASAGPVKVYIRDEMKFEKDSQLLSTTFDPLGITFNVGGMIRPGGGGGRIRPGDGGGRIRPGDDGDGDENDGNDADIKLECRGDFHGSIYAPKSDVTLPKNFNVFGSVVSERLTIETGGKLHFDRAFTSTDDPNGITHLLGWHIVELPNVPTVTLRYDAIAELLRRGITPVAPGNGHFDLGIVPP